MTIAPKHITDLYGIQNGYAVFAIGRGRNKRYGIIDRDGKIVAEPEFLEFTLRLSNERYIQCCTTASYNPRYRLFDTKSGRWVAIDPNRRPWPIPGHDGLFFTSTKRYRRGIQDWKGRQIMPEKYRYIGCIGNNFIVENPQTGCFGIFTSSGEQIVPFSLKYGKICAGGIDAPTLAEKDGKWVYLDDQGKIIASKGIPEFPADVEWIYPTKQYVIYRGGEWDKCGMLDEYGHEIIPPIYNNIFPFNKKYVTTCIYNSPRAGLKDLSGNVIIPANYTFSPISGDDDLIIIHINNKQFNNTSDAGIVQIQPDGSMSEIIPALYCIPYMEYSDMIVAAPWRAFRGKRKPGHFGVFSLKGELLIPFEYDEIRWGTDPERIAVCKGDKWFFINLKNERTLF